MKHLSKIFLVFILVWAAGCTSREQTVSQAYEALVSSNLTEEAFFEAVQDFEIDNPQHFPSKIVLADFYLSKNNLQMALQYLRRAEALLSDEKDKVASDKELCMMNGLIAEVMFAQKDFLSCVDYAKKCAQYDMGKKYLYLAARALMEFNKIEEAVSSFDAAYSIVPSDMTVVDAQSYMYALSLVGRNEDAIGILEQLTSKGFWFNGLGSFAEQLYKSTGKHDKAELYSFLNHEFSSGYDNSYSLEAKIEFDINENNLTDSFEYEFFSLKKKNSCGTSDEDDFFALLRLEPYFLRFPSYYWLVWQYAKKFDSEGIWNYVPVLKKVIALNPEGYYAECAREEIRHLVKSDDGISDSCMDSILF